MEGRLKNEDVKKSKMVSDKVVFVFEICSFSVENLMRRGVIKSPTSKYFSTDFHLEVSRDSDQIHLQLLQSDSDDPPLIAKCAIFFYTLKEEENIYKNFTAPMKHTDISLAVSVDRIKKDCIRADGVLLIGYTITFFGLKHSLDEPGIQTAVNEKNNVSKQGHTTLAKSIGNILQDSRFSDVTLKVGEDTFQAHKAILASRSKVFEGMFQNGMKESQESVVEMIDIKPAIVKQMLEYIYAGAIRPLSMDRSIDLYVGADRYDLQELKEWCKEFILKHISSEEVCRVAVIADLHSDENLAKAAKRAFKKNSKKILSSEEWREFKNQHPILCFELLESSVLNDSEV